MDFEKISYEGLGEFFACLKYLQGPGELKRRCEKAVRLYRNGAVLHYADRGKLTDQLFLDLCAVVASDGQYLQAKYERYHFRDDEDGKVKGCKTAVDFIRDYMQIGEAGLHGAKVVGQNLHQDGRLAELVELPVLGIWVAVFQGVVPEGPNCYSGFIEFTETPTIRWAAWDKWD